MVYAQPPWTFTGRALYQLQLVKADEARKHIPKELKLVECFGYTLGGVYLARYEDSPAGTFDECVAMAGLVWNPPTSCAWAARVYVNNKEARDHGIKLVGLPSRLAAFNTLSQSASSTHAWWTCSSSGRSKQQQQRQHQQPCQCAGSGSGSSSSSSSSSDVVELLNAEGGKRGLPQRPVCVFQLPSIATVGFLGPRMRLSLPSFSGGTTEHPGLLQYSCDLQTNIMPVQPMQIQLWRGDVDKSSSQSGSSNNSKRWHLAQHHHQQQQHPEVLDTLLNGHPLLCLAFSDMVMKVEQPQALLLPPAPLADTSANQVVATRRFIPALAALMPGQN